jgi:predicted phosphodiesterase
MVAILACLWNSVAIGSALPNGPGSLKFVVIGDFGTGERPQYELAAQMASIRARFRFDTVITTGDNILGRQDDASDFIAKFDRPFGPLLRAGVRFYASLGNHDKPTNRFYAPWNMNGLRYYTYVKEDVRFLALDTNVLDRAQLAWIERTLRGSTNGWTICYFHHPLYSDGKQHGSALDLRVILEPIFMRYRVDLVFSGHDHIYERLEPQQGISYFVVGAGGRLGKGDTRPSATTAAWFDQDLSVMLVEVAGDELLFETVSRTGVTVDSGVIRRRPKM